MKEEEKRRYTGEDFAPVYPLWLLFPITLLFLVILLWFKLVYRLKIIRDPARRFIWGTIAQCWTSFLCPSLFIPDESIM